MHASTAFTFTSPADFAFLGMMIIKRETMVDMKATSTPSPIILFFFKYFGVAVTAAVAAAAAAAGWWWQRGWLLHQQ